MSTTPEEVMKKFREFLNEEKEVLDEARLSKIFRRRAKQKAKRQEEQYGYQHRKWAAKQQERINKAHPELEELYLKEIETAQAASKAVQEYLNKIREIRKKKIQEKAKFEKPTGKKRKTLPSPYEGEGPEGKNFPYKKARTGGVAKVYQRRIKKISGAGAAQGEIFGPGLGAGAAMEEQINIPQEEKGDGNTNN